MGFRMVRLILGIVIYEPEAPSFCQFLAQSLQLKNEKRHIRYDPHFKKSSPFLGIVITLHD